ncbi:hypothetical protein HNP46_006774 [Pseudomonas nitritireducens]|uniref:Uncharacterized protein n=1 Tax=Pseudomonas nitroreducens TaxID=46680 RepID=A0A7W7KSR2_PSENT|nr:hypothetical protein [Pseudomonas nitritireducens]MBB4867855.1 hypothetical protein [Pseudomonas nitritireducens]
MATQEMVEANPDDLRPFHPVRFVTLDTRSGEKQIPLHAFHSQELERTHIRSTYATWLPGFKEEKERYLTDPIFDQQLKGLTLGLRSANEAETDLDHELLVKWTTDEMQCGLDARQVAGMVLCRSTASFLCQFPHLEASPVVMDELAGVLANRVPLKAGICRERLAATAAPPGSFHFAKNYSIPFIQSLMSDMHSLVVPLASVCSDDFFTQLIGISNSSLLFARMLKEVLGMDVSEREVFINPSRYEAEKLAVTIPAGVDVSFGTARKDTSDWAVATQAVCRLQEGSCTIRGIPTDMSCEELISRFRASWANPEREPGHLDILAGLAKVEGQDSVLAMMERPDDWELAYQAFGPDVLRGREGELNDRLQTLAAVDVLGI